MSLFESLYKISNSRDEIRHTFQFQTSIEFTILNVSKEESLVIQPQTLVYM